MSIALSFYTFWYDATNIALLDLDIQFFFFLLHFLSICVRLDGDCCWAAIFRSLQRFLIGFKSGLWLREDTPVLPLLRVLVLLEA